MFGPTLGSPRRDPVGRVLLAFFLAVVLVLVLVLTLGRGGDGGEEVDGGPVPSSALRVGERLCALLDDEVPVDELAEADPSAVPGLLRERADALRDAMGDSDPAVDGAVGDAAVALERLADATEADPTGAQSEALVRALAADAAYLEGQALLDDALAGCG